MARTDIDTVVRHSELLYFGLKTQEYMSTFMTDLERSRN